MNRIKLIELLHKSPPLFEALASLYLPTTINNDFKYNKYLTLAGLKLYLASMGGRQNSIWQSVLFPTEIFYSMNISPFVFEVASSIMAKLNLANNLISRMECSGLTRELCSFQKCIAGAFDSGLFSKPRMIVTSSELCDSTRKVGELFSYKYSIPCFYIDVPFEDTKEALSYVKNQLIEFIQWLEKHTGKTFSEEKFKKSIALSNELRANMLRIIELRRKYPGIMGSKPVMGLFNFNLLYGSTAGINISEILYKELEEKTWHYKPAGSLIKILWLHFVPFYKEYFTEVLNKNPHVSVVFEEMNNVYWDKLSLEDPLESLAKKILASPFRGPTQNRLRKIINLRNLFDADGVIHFSQLSCRKCNGGVRILKDAFREKRVPFLDLSADCIDSRNYSEGQLKTRLEAFIELFDE